MTRRFRTLVFSILSAFIAALLVAPHAATAGGLYVPGNGAQALGRAGAFVAKADDPTALAHNPAGFAKQSGTRLHLGVNLLNFRLDYRRAGSYEANTHEDLGYAGTPYPSVSDESRPAVGLFGMQAIPTIAVSTDFGIRETALRFGFGLYAPHGYPERNFSPQYIFQQPGVAPPPQRYDMMWQKTTAALPSVAVAYRPHEMVDVGVRLSWGFAKAQAQSYLWAARNYEEWVQNDGTFTMDVSDDFIPSFAVGLLFRPDPAFEFGAAYNSAMHIDAKGTGQAVLGDAVANPAPGVTTYIEPEKTYFHCDGNGTVTHLAACLSLTLPQTASAGGRWIFRGPAGEELGDVELDLRWENWSAGSTGSLIVDGFDHITGLSLNEVYLPHGFEDVWSVRLGGSFRAPLAGHALTFSAGAAHDTATAPDSWQRVDMDGAARTTLAVGAAYELSGYRIAIAGGIVIEPDRSAPLCNPDLATPGCSGSLADTPWDERDQPDPAQPTGGPKNAVESPFNGGDYSSGYLLFGLGVTKAF